MERGAGIVHPQPDFYGHAGLPPRGVPGGLHRDLGRIDGQMIGEGVP
jgi:hypothetical protein